MHDVQVHDGVNLFTPKHIFEPSSSNICALHRDVFGQMSRESPVDSYDFMSAVQLSGKRTTEAPSDARDDDPFLAYASSIQKKTPSRSSSPREIRPLIESLTTSTFARITLSSSSNLPSKCMGSPK